MADQFGSKIINLCVAYMDVGEGREQERKLCETQAIAGLLLTFHALILIILNPNLIRPDLCRGSLSKPGREQDPIDIDYLQMTLEDDDDT